MSKYIVHAESVGAYLKQIDGGDAVLTAKRESAARYESATEANLAAIEAFGGSKIAYAVEAVES